MASSAGSGRQPVAADGGASGVHDAIHAASGPCAVVQRCACVRSASRSCRTSSGSSLRAHASSACVSHAESASQSRSRRGLSAGGSERRTSRPSSDTAASGSGVSTSSAGSTSRACAAGHTCESDAKVPRGSCTAIQGNCRHATGLASAPPHACRPQPHDPAVWNTQRPERRPRTDRVPAGRPGRSISPTPSRGCSSPAPMARARRACRASSTGISQSLEQQTPLWRQA